MCSDDKGKKSEPPIIINGKILRQFIKMLEVTVGVFLRFADVIDAFCGLIVAILEGLTKRVGEFFDLEVRSIGNTLMFSIATKNGHGPDYMEATRDYQRVMKRYLVSDPSPLHKKIPKELMAAVNEALIDAHTTYVNFENIPSMPNAERACGANRRAMMLLFLVRFEYRSFIDAEVIQEFQADIVRTIEENDKLKEGMSPDSLDAILLDQYSDSEKLRLDILDALRNDDTRKARQAMKAALPE